MVLLAVFSFVAGFIDAVVGGGGLIIMPYLLINFQDWPLPTLFGTNKLSALSGTSVSAINYARRIRFNGVLLCVLIVFAFVFSYLGAQTLNLIDSQQMKPFILMALVVIAAYTFLKKDLGTVKSKDLPLPSQLFYGAIISSVVGFYDGFFGPGTGSFFVLGFVIILGFEFVQASAYAKLINCVTNISALIVFIRNGQCVYSMAIAMALFNMAGSYFGSKAALTKGNAFVRKVFLIVVVLMILKYGYDVFSA